MATATPGGGLVPVTADEVDRWLRKAWPRSQGYPDVTACHTLATRINVIVHRGNANPQRINSLAAVKERRSHLLKARKCARALGRALAPVREYHQSVADMLETLVAPSRLDPEPDSSTAIEELHRAVEVFVALEVSPVVDHQDPILWIAKAATRIWSGLRKADTGDPPRDVPLGKKPTSPLTSFILLVLEAIRWEPLPSNDTVSQHLRVRHNRPRDRRKVREEGA